MSSESVTVVVTRRVKTGKEAAYEAWLAELVRAASALPGFLGTTVQRPNATGPRDYTSVFRFDSLAHLTAFEESDLRRDALAKVAPMVEGDARWRTLTGLELWFSPPADAVVPTPSRWRMSLVVIVVVFTLVLSIGRLAGLVLADAPAELRLLVTIVIEVFLMTYILMPRLTRWLARWIYPGPRR